MPMSWTFRPPTVEPIARLIASQKITEEAVAHELLALSQPLVPVEEGVLKASGRVVEHDGGFAVTYGLDDDGTDKHAPSNQYAVRQHEDAELHHPNGGQWKFLEQPANAEHGKLREAAMAALRATL